MISADVVRARTAHALTCLAIQAEGLIIDFLLKQSCELASARTWVVNRALELDATHLLFVDSDICPFGDRVLQKMLAHNKPIVGVEYNARKFPLERVYKPHHEEWQKKRSETELYEAQFAGTGFLLIDLSMFKDPKFGINEDGKRVPWFSFGRDSQGALTLGEDAWFCCMARDYGYTTWIDPTIKVGHVGEYIY